MKQYSHINTKITLNVVMHPFNKHQINSTLLTFLYTLYAINQQL